MPHLSRAEVRAFDRFAIETLGIPACVLMENAGRGAAELLRQLGIRGRVVIACGKGNNGGDGLVMARHLANWGVAVLPLVFANVEDLSPDARLQWDIVQKMRLLARVCPCGPLDEAILADELARADWIVDALFGTGLVGPVRQPFDRVIEIINASERRVLACDIPTGLDCDSGKAVGATVRAEHTATFVAPKRGFVNPGALVYTGVVHVIDIGVVPTLFPS